MVPFLYKRWFNRLVSGVVAGLTSFLLSEVLLNIRYRYYEIFADPAGYLYAALFGALALESLYRTGRLLDQKYSWDKGPIKRFFIQNLTGVLAVIFWLVIIRLSFNLITFPGKLIILTDEFLLLLPPLVIIILLCVIDLGYFLNEGYRRSLAEVERFRKENAEYQFEMLKLQLNPHFLFNSLNTLSSLVHEDKEKAGEFTRRLSEVYRYVLDNRHRELVLLRDEVEFIRSFSFLQGLRFEGMIHFRFDILDSSLDRKIAPMTLQLLVENAFKHNVVSRKNPLEIEIHSDDENLSVSNNLQLKGNQTGTGVGLKNISSRYAFLTERKIEIIKEDHLFKVIVPLI